MGVDSPRGQDIQEHGTKKSRCNKVNFKTEIVEAFFFQKQTESFFNAEIKQESSSFDKRT